jgi:hypothetical protein
LEFELTVELGILKYEEDGIINVLSYKPLIQAQFNNLTSRTGNWHSTSKSKLYDIGIEDYATIDV